MGFRNCDALFHPQERRHGTPTLERRFGQAPATACFAVWPCAMTGPDDRPPRHTLADHRLGADLAHIHDGDADHDHDDFERRADRGQPALDRRQRHADQRRHRHRLGRHAGDLLASVHLRRLGEDLTSRYYVVARETLFRSPVALTPYQSEERIDDARARRHHRRGLRGGRHRRPTTSTPASVILTGEALRRENAQAIADLLAEQGGEFVCATAGHHMEAMLAAYGSGAARVSHDQGKRILNIDIGGGTTKLALVENGRVVATAAIHIGGRLQVVGRRRPDRPARSGRPAPRRAGRASTGARATASTPAELDRVAECMADALVAAIRMRPLPPPLERALPHRADRRARPDRRHDVLGRRRRIRLRPRGARLRRHGPAARPRAARAARRRRAALAAAAGRRMHPRHRARRLRIQRAALRQHQLHHRSRRAAAAPQSAGAAAALSSASETIDPDDARRGDPRAISPPST